MQSILTHYLPATNYKGSRVVATASGNKRARVVLSWDNADRDPHTMAAQELCRRLGWKGTLVKGDTKTGHVFVFYVDSRDLIQV